MSKKHLGSGIDDFLKEDGIFEEAQAQAVNYSRPVGRRLTGSSMPKTTSRCRACSGRRRLSAAA